MAAGRSATPARPIRPHRTATSASRDRNIAANAANQTATRTIIAQKSTATREARCRLKTAPANSSSAAATIPQEIRERLGLLPGIEVDFVVKGNVVEIVKSRRTQSRMAKHLRRVLGSATTRMSTDEIMKLTRG